MLAAILRLVAPRGLERPKGERSLLNRDPLVRAGLAGAVLWMGLFALGVATVGSTKRGEDVMGDLVYLVPVIVATVLSFVAAVRTPARRERILWRLLAVSNLFWLTGEVIWAWFEIVAQRESPFPSIADVFYLASYAVVIPAVLLAFAPALRLRSWRALLDASIMVAAVAFLGWTLLIRPQLEWGASLATAVGIAYPLFGVAILMLLVSVTYGGYRSVPASIGLVAVAFGISALTDSLYTYLNVLHALVPGKWLNLGWQAEALLLSFAALLAIRGREGEAEPRLRSSDVSLPLVLTGFALTVLALGIDLVHGRLTVGAGALALYAVLAVIARLLVTARERETVARRLEDALRERERAEAELERSVSLLQATLDSTVDGVLVVDSDGRISGYNKRFLDMWSLPEEVAEAGDDAALAHVLEQLEDPEAFLHRVRELYAHPEETSFDVLTFRDGRIFERSSLPQRLAGRTVGRVWSFHDVTDQRRLENDLRQAQKMEAVGQLAGGIAHDFNNLLTAVIGYSEVLQLKLADSPLQREAASIREASERAAALTRQLLAFSRKQTLQPRPVDLNEVTTGIAQLLRPLIGENIRLTIAPGESLGIVEVDPGQIEQVILNLSINARDAMPDGGHLTIRTANVDSDPAQVLLQVSDTGTGMSEETKARIFEPFFTTKEQGRGTGLGLATVLGIVQQSGGTVTVDSEPGRGTTFGVLLPRMVARNATSATSDGPVEVDRAAGTVLLVEDEEIVRSLVKEVLGQAGFEVLEAGCGEDALDVAAGFKGTIDLVLTDLVMPGMGGRDLADRVLSDRPRARVIYMSGYTEERIAGLVQGGAAFLQKPFTMAELIAKTRALLDVRAAA